MNEYTGCNGWMRVTLINIHSDAFGKIIIFNAIIRTNQPIDPYAQDTRKSLKATVSECLSHCSVLLITSI